jgi:hypothetical protein
VMMLLQQPACLSCSSTWRLYSSCQTGSESKQRCWPGTCFVHSACAVSPSPLTTLSLL